MTIAKDIGVNYRKVYDWIDNYKKHGLDGIRNEKKWLQKTGNIYYKELGDDKRSCI